LNFAFAISSCWAGWDRSYGALGVLCILLNASNWGCNGGGATCLGSATTTAKAFTTSNGLLGRENLIERLIKLSRHIGFDVWVFVCVGRLKVIVLG
jgi:hypothetical protein